MISDTITLIKEELGRYIELNRRGGDSITAADVIMDNIAVWESDNTSNSLSNQIVISLVNVEEESTLKNGKPYIKNGATGGTLYINRPIHVNLYLLFALPPEANAFGYERALQRLSLVIEFFQSKKLFTLSNSPTSSLNDDNNLELKEIRAVMELYTLTFEQLNHLWGSLGGKQVPSVMYKVRLTKIQSRIAHETPVITDIGRNLGGIDNC